MECTICWFMNKNGWMMVFSPDTKCRFFYKVYGVCTGIHITLLRDYSPLSYINIQSIAQCARQRLLDKPLHTKSVNCITLPSHKMKMSSNPWETFSADINTSGGLSVVLYNHATMSWNTLTWMRHRQNKWFCGYDNFITPLGLVQYNNVIPWDRNQTLMFHKLSLGNSNLSRHNWTMGI